MKRLSLNRSKKQQNASQNSAGQAKISSFFDVFKTPESKKENALKAVVNEDVIIENTPEKKDDNALMKKRKLFKLKKQTSKVGAALFGSSTASLISGNLDTKATKVCTPPKSEETRKRPLPTPDAEIK